MAVNITEKKGGLRAAFFALFAVSTLGLGGSLQPPLAILRVAGFCAAMLFLWRRRGEPVEISRYILLVGAFVVLCLGHASSSVYVWVSLQHAVNIALAGVFLVWAILIAREDPEQWWEKTVSVIAAIAGVEVLVALVQKFAQGTIRPHGTFDNPNFLSEFLAAAAILCLSRLLSRKDRVHLRMAEAAGVALFLAAALSLAESRGVLLAAVPAFGFLLVGRFGARRGTLGFAILGLPALAVLGWASIARFFSPDIYNYGRWIMWKSAVRTFLDHPFGVGLGGYKYFWYATQSPVHGGFRQYAKFATTAHNEYLEVLSGLGAPGFLLFLAVLLVPFLLASREWKVISEEKRGVALGAAGCLLLTGIHAMFDFNLHEFGIVFLGAMMLGGLLSCLRRPSSWVVRIPKAAAYAGIAACGALLLISLVTFAGVALYERGLDQFREGDLKAAESSFLSASTVDPLRAPYPDALSALYFRRFQEEARKDNDPQRSFALLKESMRWEDRARDLNPRDPRYVSRLSSLFVEVFLIRREPSDVRLALTLAGSALRINPFSVETLWQRAEIYLLIGRTEEAIRDLELAVAVEPNFCRGYARRAELAGAADPIGASAWSEKAESCRKNAATFSLEDYERWLVDSPEGK